MTEEEQQKEDSFQRLLLISKNRSFDLYNTVDDYHKGCRSWPIEWYEFLCYADFDKNPQKKQQALNDTLHRLTMGDFPSTLKQMQEEKQLFHLTLEAGANPNYKYRPDSESIFSSVLFNRKIHMAVEVAQAKDFYFSENTDAVFDALRHDLSYYKVTDFIPFPERNFSDEEPITATEKLKTARVYFNFWKEQNKELVYTLFQKNIYPHDEKIYKALEPIVSEMDAQFFEKKKEQMVRKLTLANT